MLRETESLAAALDDPRRLGQVLVFLSVHFYIMGTYDQAIAAAQRALALATSGDSVLQALANYALGAAYGARGNYRQAITCNRQAVSFFDGARRHERFGIGFLPAVNARARLARAMPRWVRSLRAMPSGTKGSRLPRHVRTPRAS